MKKKVFFILSSLKAGGAERVFWLVSQHFNKSSFDVSIVVLNSDDAFFSTELDGIKVIKLNTGRASKSLIKLYSFIKKEKPDAVFSTGGQVNVLLGMISLFLKIPTLIARPTNQDNTKYLTAKAKVLKLFSNGLFKRFDKVICQSEEIKAFVRKQHQLPEERLIVIPNPVCLSGNSFKRTVNLDHKRLIVVARLTAQKGMFRLLEMMVELPLNYHLTIVGDGPLKDELADYVVKLNLGDRVNMTGLINNVLEVVSAHDVFVLPSFIEGFPNVVIESLSVGTPVVSFQVGGISEIIINDFNGFILNQSDIEGFKQKIIIACERSWDQESIQNDIQNRFSLDRITQRYEGLVINQ